MVRKELCSRCGGKWDERARVGYEEMEGDMVL